MKLLRNIFKKSTDITKTPGFLPGRSIPVRPTRATDDKNISESLTLGLKFAGLFGFIGTAFYFVGVKPMLNRGEDWVDLAEDVRKHHAEQGRHKDALQPNEMRVWSDPFAPPKNSTDK